jgi:hypothetical protein
LEETPDVQSEPRSGDPATRRQQLRRVHSPNVLGLVAGLVGVAGIAASAWVYSETQRDIGRISTDIAQIKLSLELFGKQQANAAPPPTSDTALSDLANRLSVLEENWRGGAPLANTPSALPPIPDSTITGAVVPQGGDCLPTGTRFMVAAGDVYPVCGTPAKVEIGAVDDGYITLADGTVIAQGGTIGLPGSQCMIGVVPADGGAISGFAEIKVTC